MDTEDREIQLLLDAVYLCRGHDFRHYSAHTIKRRLQVLMQRENLQHFSELIPKVVHDEGFLQRFLRILSINVTEFFRDPQFFLALQQQVFPLLRTFPFFKIWHAGCATGEEVYSLAMLLQEQGLYDRARIYATDNNKEVIAKAKAGIFKADDVRARAAAYGEAEGTGSLNNYFSSDYGYAKVDAHLKRNITFAHHDLTCDGVFAETQLIICRNVLIYFDKTLKQRVLQLFHSSLSAGGRLCLGEQESIDHLGLQSYFSLESPGGRIYKKTQARLPSDGATASQRLWSTL